MRTVFLITPALPREHDPPERIRRSTMNCLVAAEGLPFSYPEACLVLEVGRWIGGQFEFHLGAATSSGEPLSSPSAWVTFLNERCPAGSVLCTEDGTALALGAF